MIRDVYMSMALAKVSGLPFDIWARFLNLPPSIAKVFVDAWADIYPHGPLDTDTIRTKHACAVREREHRAEMRRMDSLIAFAEKRRGEYQPGTSEAK